VPAGAPRAAPPLGVGTKLAYGIGQAAEGLKNSAFAGILLFYYVQVLGVSPGLAGTILFAALVFDAVTDPLIGSYSDSFQSRLGRRHPFMYAAALPMALSFYLAFSPPAGLSERGLALWLFVFTVAARAAMTLYHVPHLSLGAELSWAYAERARVVAYRVVGGFSGAVAFFVASARIFFQPSERFADGQLDPAAYSPMALAMGLAMALLILFSALGTHHRIPYLVRPRRVEPFSAGRLAGEMREALRNRNFLMFFLAILCFLVGRGFSDGLGIFMGTYFWELETRHIFQVTAFGLAGIVAGTPLWAIAVRWWEKRTVFLIGCAGLGFFTAIAPVLRLVGWFPANEHPTFLPLIYGSMFLASTVAAGAVVVPGAMLADIADEHELATGHRQEGIFFGALSFSGKAAAGMGGWLAGLALEWIQFPKPQSMAETVARGSVDPETLFALGMVAGPGLAVFGVVAVWLASFYALDRKRHAQIAVQLPSRGS
jgi:Na+/melibiose symporter-like transporter